MKHLVLAGMVSALAMSAQAQPIEKLPLNRPLTDMTDSGFVAQGYDGHPTVLSEAELADYISHYDVVFFGEIHSHPGVHLQEMKLLQGLYARNPDLIVSFEQFESDTQGVVDAYLAGKIGEHALIEKGRAWPQYVTAYRPMMEFARVHKLSVVAAEAPTWAISCIGQIGPEVLTQFTPEERTWVAKDLHIATSGAYRDKYLAFASGGGHGGDPVKAERSFAAQVARDDTMAERIAAALDAHPGAKLIHYNGYFHSEGFLGTVERLKLRKPGLKIAVITPVEVEDPAQPGLDPAKVPPATIWQLVYPSPPSYVEGEDMSGFMASMKRTPCKYAPDMAKSAGN